MQKKPEKLKTEINKIIILEILGYKNIHVFKAKHIFHICL